MPVCAGGLILGAAAALMSLSKFESVERLGPEYFPADWHALRKIVTRELFAKHNTPEKRSAQVRMPHVPPLLLSPGTAPPA